VAVGIAVDDATVGQDDVGREQLVGGQPVLAAEDAEPAAERQAGDADRRSAAARDRAPVFVERAVELAEPHAGADRHRAVADRDPTHAESRAGDALGRLDDERVGAHPLVRSHLRGSMGSGFDVAGAAEPGSGDAGDDQTGEAPGGDEPAGGLGEQVERSEQVGRDRREGGERDG
jgi:hypothetical protein